MTKKLGFLIVSLLCFGALVSCSSTSQPKESTDQKKAALYYDYGTKHLVDKDYTKALTNLKMAAELDPENSKIHNNLGMTYYFKNESELAVKYLQKSIELNPKNSDAKNNLASVYFHQKKFRKAYDLYLVILEDLEYTQQFRTHYNLALIDLKFNRYKTAHKRLLNAIKENKDYCPAHFELGKYAKKINNYHSALKHFDDATKGTCVNHPLPHYEKAQVLIDLGQDQKALYTLRDIISRFPETKYSTLAKRKLQVLNINKFKVERSAKRHSTPSRKEL